MKKLPFLFLLAGLLLAGCGTAPEVTSYVNPISGRRTDVLGQNLIDEPGNNREMLWLNAYRDYKDRNSFIYYIEAIYGATEQAGYLDIGPGRSLTIVVDGEELHFTGLGSLSKDEDDGALFERARYEASPYDIQKIAYAKDVTVKLSGRNGTIVRQFAQENFDKFRQFADQTSQF
jgi:hypothetical protein